MVDRAVNRTTPRRCNCNGVQVSTVRTSDYRSIAKTERERKERDGFMLGTRWAAIALGFTFGPMFAIGIMLGWL